MFSRNAIVKAPLWSVLVLLYSIDLLGENTSGIQGKVVDKAEHAPIHNAYVLVHSNGGTDKSVRTDGNGRYRIELLPNIYDVLISADGFAPTCRKIQVARGDMAVFDAVLVASDVGMQASSPKGKPAPPVAQGIVGDIPGGFPSDGTRTAGILSSEPRPPSVAGPTRLRIARDVMRTFLLTKVNPNYPSEAERQRVEGTVLLHVNIDKSGNVSGVDPVSGHPLLIPAAIDAVKQWKYKPYLINQTPAEVETTVLIKFVISGGNTFSVIA